MPDSNDISDICMECGKAIPALPRQNALCVRCRYGTGATKKLDGADEKTEFEVALGNYDGTLSWAAQDAREADGGSAEALHWLRVGILIALEGGRADGIASRTAAIACVAGLFDSPTDAADRIGLDRKAVCRAHEAILEKLKSQAEAQQKAHE